MGVQGYFAMDDFTYRRDAVVSVPEPNGLLLAALGLGGLLLVRGGRAKFHSAI